MFSDCCHDYCTIQSVGKVGKECLGKSMWGCLVDGGSSALPSQLTQEQKGLR